MRVMGLRIASEAPPLVPQYLARPPSRGFRQATQTVACARACAELAVIHRGRDRVDHPPGGHDDVANAVAGVVDLILGRKRMTWADLGYGVDSGVMA